MCRIADRSVHHPECPLVTRTGHQVLLEPMNCGSTGFVEVFDVWDEVAS